MRYIIALILCVLPAVVLAQAWEDRQVFNAEAGETPLRVISSTDTFLFEPLIAAFVADNPGISVDYMVTGTADIDRIVRAAPDDFDIVISSAMDLQLKLANDGFGRAIEGIQLPAWAQWHQSLFAFTFEPATIVINRAAFEDGPLPETRQQLIEILRARPEDFFGRVGTYDIRQSGLGYLFATQDARASETYWRLMEVMGGLDVRLYCCSADMIDDLVTGEIAVAYNVLGSYASARAGGKDVLEIIQPSDFQTIMMRTALVMEGTPETEAASSFVRHLVENQSGLGTGAFSLPPLAPYDTESEREAIGLDPALLTFLDRLKRRRFLAEWESAVIQN
ncbi:ABC transporter substrate-binding protein [Ruegeria sp. HKCCD4884]|uniref:ABC transporter substrate-binding protein n=1 Tax=Ruegeria sp. HKCCD4884 TaxID=2683022 RepID=UPI001491E11A|nr:ABC transporter substrate-binding protein [Ruegeria sp. HKCCD4884]NOD94788.1 ABC transporter substrate-binding protein [Ruegeria sp. HKCCD4884]